MAAAMNLPRAVLQIVIGFFALLWRAEALGDCSLTNTGITPLNDLWTSFYHGYVGGLYPAGADNAPPQHLAAGIDIATNQIRPLDAFGNYDPANGKIVMISVGMSNYPNSKIAYYSSRTRAYTNVPGTLNPEPFAYESAFSVRWMIENQINGTGNLNYDPGRGPAVAPWLAWGPYLWTDGTNPRSDGFVWLCSDLQNDFTHPSSSGVAKVDQELIAFFKTHATTAPWFLRPPAQQISCSILLTQTGWSPGMTVAFFAIANSQGHTITQYAWTFDDGDFSFAQNPSKVFPTPGVYNVRLTVSDDAGNTVTRTTLIPVQTNFWQDKTEHGKLVEPDRA